MTASYSILGETVDTNLARAWAEFELSAWGTA